MLYTIINDLELLPPGRTAPVIAEDETSTEAAKASSSVAAPQPAPIVEHPQQGVFHPRLLGRPEGDYMTSPREYAEWYERTHSWVTEDTPRVGILLYRKHVVTEQGYIPNMITLLESQGMMPIPVFINGTFDLKMMTNGSIAIAHTHIL
jgi:cobalamin biosynthesis Mg chelatase CobN